MVPLATLVNQVRFDIEEIYLERKTHNNHNHRRYLNNYAQRNNYTSNLVIQFITIITYVSLFALKWAKYVVHSLGYAKRKE